LVDLPVQSPLGEPGIGKTRISEEPTTHEPAASVKPHHVVLWGAWYGSRNTGDQAVLVTLTRLLAEAASPVRFTVLTDNARWVREYGPRESGTDIDALQNWRQLPRVLAAVATCDLFVIGGGVPFYDESYHLAIMGTLVSTARCGRVPYMTWAVATQEIRRSSSRRLYRWVLEHATAVTCRDAASEATLRACGVSRDIVRVGDPAFRMEWGAPEEAAAGAALDRAGALATGRPLAALCCRRLHSDHSYSGEHYGKRSAERIENTIACFAAALDRLWKLGFQPVFVPMHTVAPDDDREMTRRVVSIARHGSAACALDEALRPAVVAALLGRCELGLTSRLHAAVLGAAAGVPLSILAIDPKLGGMAGELDLLPWSRPDASVTPAQVADLVGDLAARLQEARLRLRARVDVLRRSAEVPAYLAAAILRGASPGRRTSGEQARS
jgi:polysaccharide pyruvyl transferase WcaK-like protein